MGESFESRFIRIISGRAGGIGPAFVRGGLALLEPFYRCATWLRNAAFDQGLKKVHHVDRPVISIGNITTGGTGKTPVVAWLAEILRTELNLQVGILTRGYKARDGKSDEAELLREQLGQSDRPAVHVLVGANRAKVAAEAIAAHPEIGCLIMDDGFQHRRLHRELDIVLIDATNPFGFGHVLPRGLLRESLTGLKRADAFLMTRFDQVQPNRAGEIEQEIRRFNSEAPIFRCSQQIDSFVSAGVTFSGKDLSRRRVVAFAGIGNPESFRALLMQAGCDVVATQWFPDHHRYSDGDVRELRAMAKQLKALLITTAKDAVKFASIGTGFEKTVFIANLRVSFVGGEGVQLAELVKHRTLAPEGDKTIPEVKWQSFR